MGIIYTRRKSLSNITCSQKFKASYGFSQQLLNSVKIKLQGMDDMKRHGGLVIDEIKLSSHLDMTASTRIEGFVDLGQFSQEVDKHIRAHHGLVVMFQPFIGKWTQIIGKFMLVALAFSLNAIFVEFDSWGAYIFLAL